MEEYAPIFHLPLQGWLFLRSGLAVSRLAARKMLFSNICQYSMHVNPYPAKLIYLNFQPLGNYAYLFNLRPNIHKSSCLNTHFIPISVI